MNSAQKLQNIFLKTCKSFTDDKKHSSQANYKECNITSTIVNIKVTSYDSSLVDIKIG